MVRHEISCGETHCPQRYFSILALLFKEIETFDSQTEMATGMQLGTGFSNLDRAVHRGVLETGLSLALKNVEYHELSRRLEDVGRFLTPPTSPRLGVFAQVSGILA